MIRVLALVLLLGVSSALAESANIGVVYSIAGVQIRRVIVPDSDDQLIKQNWVDRGEALLVVPRGVDITAELEKFTHTKPTLPLAAILDKSGKVVQVIMADPALDSSPGGTMVKAYPGAKVGDAFDFIRGVFVSPDGIDVTVVPDEITPSLTLDSFPR